MLSKVSKHLLPFRIRNLVGLRSAKYATRVPILGPLYLKAAWGITGLTILRGGDIEVKEGLVVPWDALPTYINVFVDRVYDRLWHPVDGDTVLDIGAYVGMYGSKCSMWVGTKGKVIAIEPSPDNLGYLRNNLGTWTNVTVYTKALSNKIGTSKFYLGRLHAGFEPYHSAEYIEVETTTMDSMASELGITPTFIKINTAFSINMLILEGAQETLKLPNLKVIVYCPFEMCGRRPGLEDLISLLKRYGFSVTKGDICLYAEKSI